MRWANLCVKNAQNPPRARAWRTSRSLTRCIESDRWDDNYNQNNTTTMSESASVPRPSAGEDPSRDDNNNWILLNHCELRGMNIIVDPATGNVVAFSTRYCRDGERWKEGSQMPALVQQNGINFSTLQTLDLHNSRYLVELNAALGSQLPQLRRVLLTRCDRLVRLPESLSSLQYLEELDLTDSPMVEELPSSIGNLKSLKRLVFGGGSGHHNKVLRTLPDSIGELSNLEELVLDKCKSLKAIPSTIGGLSKLTRLSMKECKSIVELPESIGNCSQLIELFLLKCIKLVQLPNSVGNLKNLEDLDLGKCSSLQALPESIGELQCLVYLSLRDCPTLGELPESITRLSSLFQLNCKNCVSLKSIPTDLTRAMPNLTEVEFSGCDMLSHVPMAMH